jgi:hypothetical protein
MARDKVGERWLTKEASTEALKALRVRRKKADAKKESEADLPASVAAGYPKRQAWRTLEHVLERHATSRNPERAVRFARFLLRKRGLRELTTTVRPRSEGTGVDTTVAPPTRATAAPRATDVLPAAPPEPEGAVAGTNSTAPPVSAQATSTSPAPAPPFEFDVSCPQTIGDHRIVILGCLSKQYHPAVFVGPRDDTQLWYPQFGEHNPLRVGTAFCFLAHIGNPIGIWHFKELPMTADVLVCALTREWPHGYGSKHLTAQELTERLEELECKEPEYKRKERQVNRSLPWAHGVTLWHEGGTRQLFVPPSPIDCVAPVRFDWDDNTAAVIEIHAGEADDLVCAPCTVGPGTRLVLQGQKRTRSDIVLLQGAGRYRVRLFPVRQTFLDPPYECWLSISEPPPSEEA